MFLKLSFKHGIWVPQTKGTIFSDAQIKMRSDSQIHSANPTVIS